MAYDVGVRSYLTGKGVQGTDIGFDKNSGNVTIRKQPFYKPELNMSNTTYSNQANLDNAYKTYSSQLPVIQPDGTTGTTANVGTNSVSGPKTMMSSTSTTTPSKKPDYTNPYVTQYEDIMKRLDESNKAMQQPVDIYSSPEYAAAKANQDKAAKQSTRVAQESMGASGFGRSTNLQDRAQGIQNEANDYLQTQLVPQIQSALANKNQQQYNNLLQQFNTIYQMVNQADSQHQNEINNASNDRTFDYNTGRDNIADTRYADETAYSRSSDNPLVKGQLQENQLNQFKIDAYPEEQKANVAKIKRETELGNMDIETAKYNLTQLKDLNSNYNQAAKIDLQLKQLDLKNAPEKARLEIQQLQKTVADIGVVHYKPQTATEIATDAANLKILQYKADNLESSESKPPKSTDYKLDPKFAEDIAYIKNNPAAVSMLDTEAQKFIDAYGYDGYVAMRKSAGLADPVAP